MRLYLRFYAAMLASLLLFVLATIAMLRPFGGQEAGSAKVAQLIQNTLPEADAPKEQQQSELQRLSQNLDAEVTLLAPTGIPIAAVGRPPEQKETNGWLHPWEMEHVWSARLPDGRWVAADVPAGYRHPFPALLLTLILIAVAVATGAYPVARRLTRRLERLQHGVETLGGGDLGARVAVEGNDEVAGLAKSFNGAAARIEQLMGSHKALLANASHELRTPLTRIRMTAELAKETLDATQKARLEQDIAELDRLIEEILLASRLDALSAETAQEEVDLLALAAEECIHYPEVDLDGMACMVLGERSLLRSMFRNLLDNACTHGRPPVNVAVTPADGGARIIVLDDGNGVPEADRESVFQPFFRRTESRSARGFGLGLSLVRQIARRHHGDAHWIDAQGKQGVEVVLRNGRTRTIRAAADPSDGFQVEAPADASWADASRRWIS